MPPPPPVPDYTATLAPRDSSPPAPPRAETESVAADDPERYELIGEHARGGLGRIVRAVDKRLGRTVAVKELLTHEDAHEARFMREALITARLEHPGIVPVHEAGRWPNGDPYYVMKLVEGRTLKELIAERASMRDRLELLPHVTAVADAVGYAHSEGVIHRDLKPSNIMVGAFGETIVVDWGLARDRRRDIPEPTGGDCPASGSGSVTVSGKVIGTPAYMAPEQARGDLVDERADVYAIGAVLYELMAGVAPHADTTPQATLERVLAGPPAPLPAVAPHVPGELVTIVHKAMSRDPGARYPNATALAEDLRRYQTGKLVSAHSYSAWSLVRRKVSHHRGVVAVALASAIALGVVGVESFRRVVAEKNNAQQERGRAEDALSQAEKRKRELVLLQAATALRKDPTATLAWLKTSEISDGDRAHVVSLIDEAVSLGVARHVFRPGDWTVDAVFSADGKSVVVAVKDGALRAYDLRTEAVRVIGKAPSAPEILELTPDGDAVITGGTLGEVILWPLRGGPPRTLLPSTGRMCVSIRFSADGRRVLVERDKGVLDVTSIDLDGTQAVQLGAKDALRTAVATEDWSKQVVRTAPNTLASLAAGRERGAAGPSELERGAPAWKPIAQTAKMIQFHALSPRGDLVLFHDGETVWKVPYAGGAPTKLASYGAKLLAFEWSPDQRTVALVGHSHDLVLADVTTGAVRELRGHTDALYTAEWTRDGARLLSASDDATARVWTVADGSSIVLRGHDDDVYRARFSPDERAVSTSSLDGSVRIWELEHESSRALAEGASVERLVLDGRHAVVKTPTTVTRWDLTTGVRDPQFSWAQDAKGLGFAVASRDGSLLLVPRADWSMEIRRRQGPPLKLAGHDAAITRIEFTHDGKHLVTSSNDGTLRRWDTQTGDSVALVHGNAPVRGFALARDGRIAVSIGDETRIVRPDGSSTTLGAGGKWCVGYAEFDEVRDRLLLARCDRTVALVVDGKAIELEGGYAVNRLAASKDGTRIAGAMSDRTVRVWDARTGAQISELRGHTDLVLDVAFSPDGTQLASSSYDRTIRVWELSTLRHRVLRGHAGGVERVVWRSPDQLVTGGRDGVIRLWAVPTLEVPTAAALKERLEDATTARIDRDRPASRPPGA